MRSFRQTREIARHQRMFLKLRQRHQGSDSQTAFAVGSNTVESANAFKINHAHRPRNVILHRRQKILAAGEWSCEVIEIRGCRSGLESGDRFSNRVRTDPLKRVHALLLSFINPRRILSGVIGNSRTRTPQALNTALATAPTAGIIAASAMPMTASRLSSSSIRGISSGISNEPGSL